MSSGVIGCHLTSSVVICCLLLSSVIICCHLMLLLQDLTIVKLFDEYIHIYIHIWPLRVLEGSSHLKILYYFPTGWCKPKQAIRTFQHLQTQKEEVVRKHLEQVQFLLSTEIQTYLWVIVIITVADDCGQPMPIWNNFVRPSMLNIWFLDIVNMT